MPILAPLLSSPNTVVKAYTAATIEKILSMRDPMATTTRLISTDIQPYAEPMLNCIFQELHANTAPEKMAENDQLMKCAMRIIFVSQGGLKSIFERTLSNLEQILKTISQNPSNPKFNQYCFESVSGLIK